MQKDSKIIELVYAAKADERAADELINSYIPFIRSEASSFLQRPCTEQDDEYSIAMIAFYEAIRGYEKSRGAFLKYASMLIKSRLIDHQRKESRHRGHISLYEETGEDERPLLEQIPDQVDHFEESANLAATQQEIKELLSVMDGFGVTFSDVADNSPKQERTLEACRRVICYGAENPEILDELLKTKKLPLAKIVADTGADRKTLERHRKYILAMLLIQTNGYEIIRGHLRHVIKTKGGVSI